MSSTPVASSPDSASPASWAQAAPWGPAVPAARPDIRLAGFWRRTAAALVDIFIVLAIALTLAFAYAIPTHRSASADSVGYEAGTAWIPLAMLVGIVYFVALWWGRAGGRTLAMRIFDLRVTRVDGSVLGPGASALRALGLVIAVLFVFMGVIWVAFDPKRQGWHDKIAGTLVVRA